MTLKEELEDGSQADNQVILPLTISPRDYASS